MSLIVLTMSIDGGLKCNDRLPCRDGITDFFCYLQELALRVFMKVMQTASTGKSCCPPTTRPDSNPRSEHCATREMQMQREEM